MNPLQVNPTTGEVFLRLPAPYENLIITPPRESDRDDLVLMFNDPRIYKFFLSPPFPYQPHHAEEWLRMMKDKSDKVLEALREGEAVVNGCPVQYIRDVQPDGTQLLIGDVSVLRQRWLRVSDEGLRAKMVKENSEKPVGDRSVVWTISDYLRPSHHGKGIMSAVINAVINQWMVPHMNAHIIQADIFEGNGGSVRVFEKNGFKLLETARVDLFGPGCGRIEGVHVLEWTRPR